MRERERLGAAGYRTEGHPARRALSAEEAGGGPQGGSAEARGQLPLALDSSAFPSESKGIRLSAVRCGLFPTESALAGSSPPGSDVSLPGVPMRPDPASPCKATRPPAGLIWASAQGLSSARD